MIWNNLKSLRKLLFKLIIKKNVHHNEKYFSFTGTSGSDQESGGFAASIGRKISAGMSGMISKLKSGTQPQPPPLENNPICQYFEVGKESSTAGPGLIWRVHDAYRKSDGKVSTKILQVSIWCSYLASALIRV